MVWFAKPNTESCEDCSETHRGEPDCSSCSFPKILEEGRPFLRAWELWNSLSYFGRDSGMGLSPIKLSEATNLVNFYQEPKMVLEQILDIEQIIYPILLKNTGYKNDN